jgi:hypothetical protein
MKRWILMLIVLTAGALTVAGCGTEAYDKRAEKAHLSVVKREDCKPAYGIESINEEISTPIRVCTFVNPLGERCVMYHGSDMYDIDCAPVRESETPQ